MRWLWLVVLLCLGCHHQEVTVNTSVFPDDDTPGIVSLPDLPPEDCVRLGLSDNYRCGANHTH